MNAKRKHASALINIPNPELTMAQTSPTPITITGMKNHSKNWALAAAAGGPAAA
jgi:hypothetical protein